MRWAVPIQCLHHPSLRWHCSWGFWVHDSKFVAGTPHNLTLTSALGKRVTAKLADIWKGQSLGVQLRSQPA